MRPVLSIVFIFSTIVSLYSQRQIQLVNFNWKFSLGEVTGAETVGFDDSKWQTVHLPHDASISGPFVEDSLNSDRKNGFLPRLKGWYRKNLIINQELNNKKIFLEFKGIYRDFESNAFDVNAQDDVVLLCN